MNWLQIKSGVLKILTGVSAIAGTVALFNPKWGSAMQGIVVGVSGVVAGVSIIAGTFSPHLKAADGLTEDEATAALNKASLDKSLGIPIIPEKK
jgi:hypothetical protein